MEQTESVVVQVAPDYENIRIKEMEMFGWNLHGRQEMHEQGDAYGRPSYLSEFTGTYLVKTSVSKYVKLHFVRSLTYPHRDRLQRLQDEYFGFEFPSVSPLLPGGVPIGCLLLIFWWPFWPLWYFFGYRPRLAAARARFDEINRRQQEIVAQVEAIKRE